MTSPSGITFAAKSTLSAGDITLAATGEGVQSAIRIQDGALITARSLTMNADNRTSIGADSRIELTEKLSMTTSAKEGTLSLGGNSLVAAESVHLKSENTISVLGNTSISSSLVEGIAPTIETLENVRLTAKTAHLDADDCIGTEDIFIVAQNKSGRCLKGSSLMAKITPLLKSTFSVGDTITFNIKDSEGYGSASLDFGDGASHSFAEDELEVTHTYASKGIYQVTLTVSTETKSALESLEIIVTDNIPPEILDIAFDIAHDADGYPEKQVGINVQGKTIDIDGRISQYEYDFGDGADRRLSPSAKVRHTYATWGAYQVTVRVQDNLGAWSQPITRKLVLQNKAPIVDFDLPEEILYLPGHWTQWTQLL